MKRLTTKVLHESEISVIEAMLKTNPALIYNRFEGAETMLHVAVDCARKDVVRYLCQDFPYLIFTGDALGGTPLHNVCRSSKEHGGATGRHAYELAKILLDHGAPLDRENNKGETPLLSLLCFANDDSGWTDTTRLMLQRGANPNTQNNRGDTFIHGLVSFGDNWAPVELLQVALDGGAKLDIRNKMGETAKAVAYRTDYHGCEPERLKTFLNLLNLK